MQRHDASDWHTRHAIAAPLDGGVRIRAPRRIPDNAPHEGSWGAALLGIGAVAAAGLLGGFYTVVEAAVERGAAQQWHSQQHTAQRSAARSAALDSPRVAARQLTTAAQHADAADAAPVIYSVLR